jgi:hypothetical protein
MVAHHFKNVSDGIKKIKQQMYQSSIAIVEKTFRLREVFLLQALMPPSFYAERMYDKRYNLRLTH